MIGHSSNASKNMTCEHNESDWGLLGGLVTAKALSINFQLLRKTAMLKNGDFS